MNALTGGSFRTGNYPGVTVSLLRGRSRSDIGEVVSIVDLPGIQHGRLFAGRGTFRRRDLRETSFGAGRRFRCCLDATQLERHLRFASYVARQGRPMVIALTMVDLLPRVGQSVDAAKLESALGVRVVTVDARTGQGKRRLLEAVQPPQNRWKEVAHWRSCLASRQKLIVVCSLLEGSAAAPRAGSRSRTGDPLTERIDRILLHRILGFPIFFVTLAGLFAALFWAAQPLMDLVNAGFTTVGTWYCAYHGGMFTRFLSEGVIQESASSRSFFRK